MKAIARVTGPQKTQELLLDRFLEMCSMNEQSFRKFCAECFPVFCQVLGTELTESLLVGVFCWHNKHRYLFLICYAF